MSVRPAPASVDELLELYERRGGERYGEDVTQAAHALQCAEHARRDAASDAMVAAALLHDVGHLLVDTAVEGDDRHEAEGARALAALLGPEVAAPVALHVTAKRWRCAVEPGYLASLSAASVASLELQGGPLLDPAARSRFERHPSFDGAVALRGWDDAAKDPGAAVGALADHQALLHRLATAARAAASR